MIGLIVTGQGQFATGMSNALYEIAGTPEAYAAIDYTEGDTPENFEAKLTEAIEGMTDCTGILILCDLAGSIPFKSSTEIGYPRGIEVVAGANLGMLIEMNASRAFIANVQALADQAVTVGKDQVERFVFRPAGSAIRMSSSE